MTDRPHHEVPNRETHPHAPHRPAARAAGRAGIPVAKARAAVARMGNQPTTCSHHPPHFKPTAYP